METKVEVKYWSMTYQWWCSAKPLVSINTVVDEHPLIVMRRMADRLTPSDIELGQYYSLISFQEIPKTVYLSELKENRESKVSGDHLTKVWLKAPALSQLRFLEAMIHPLNFRLGNEKGSKAYDIIAKAVRTLSIGNEIKGD